jgi:hypothetical protein
LTKTTFTPRKRRITDAYIAKRVHAFGLSLEHEAAAIAAMKALRDDCLPDGIKKELPLVPPRRCKYCRANFIPERPQDKEAKFCCANHRKAFWRYGGLPFDKMKLQIMKEVRLIVREEFAKLQQNPSPPPTAPVPQSSPALAAPRK